MPKTPDDTSLLARAEALLLDPHRCPVCTMPLGGSYCARCGMDLSGAAGTELWAASTQAAVAIRHRLDLANVSWRAQTGGAPWGPFVTAQSPEWTTLPASPPAPGSSPAAARSSAARPAPAAAGAAGRPLQQPRPVQQPHPAQQPRPAWQPYQADPPRPLALPGRSGPPTGVARPRRQWRVQHVLLGLGAALLATASIVFLVFSWRVLSLPVRAALVGTGTVVVLALASVLRRRALVQSAEAIGWLGVVLLLLDGWAVRATGLVDDLDGSVYAATVSVLCAAVLVLWGRVSGLRAGTVAAAVLLPAAPVMLVGRATSAAQVGGLLLLAVLASFARLGVDHARRAERAVLTVAAVATSAAAGAAALVATVAHGADRAPGAAAVLLLALTATSLVQAWSAARDLAAGDDDASRLTGSDAWAAAAGLAVAGAGAAAVSSTGTPPATGAAAAVALVGLLALRGVTGRVRTAVLAATRSATGLTAVLLVPVLLLALRDLVLGVLADDAAGRTAGAPAVARLGALAAVAGALLLAARARTLPASAAGHAAAGLTTTAALTGAVLAGARLDDVHGAAVALVAVGAGGLVVQGTTSTLRGDGRGGRVARSHLRAGAVAAVLLALVAAVGTSWTSALAFAALAGAAVAARRWSTHPLLRTILAAVTAAAGWVTLGYALLAAGTGTAVALAVAGSIGVAVLAVTVVERDAVVRPTRLALLATATAGGVASWTGAFAATRTTTHGHGVAAASVLVLAATVVGAATLTALRGTRRLPVAVVVAAAAAVPTCTVLGVGSAHLLLGTPSTAGTALAGLAVGVATATTAPSLHRRGTHHAVAPAAESAGWVVVAGAVVTAAAVDPQLAALTLLVAAAAVAAGAARGARGPRLWIAPALAVVSSWTSFGDLGVDTPEAYTAPLGLVLVAVAVRRWRRAGSGADLLGAGLGLVTLPTAVALGDLPLVRWELPRIALTTGLAAVLVAVALVVARRTPRPAPPVPAASAAPDEQDPPTPDAWTAQVAAQLLVVLAAAAALTLLGPVRRALTLAGDTWSVDVVTLGTWTYAGLVQVLPWTLATLALVAGTTAAARAAWPTSRRRPVHLASGWAVLATVAAPVLIVRADDLHGAGPVVLAFALGAWLGARNSVRGGQVVAQAVTLLVGATVSALVQPWTAPSDVPLVVLGVALCVTGLPRLRRDPTARSWPTLGAGLLLALPVPLLWSLPDPQTWRTLLVLLGGVVAIQVGAAERWRAPFVVGSLALAVEALVQVGPVAVDVIGGIGWWPALGLSGLVLLGLGMSYERRLQDARTALEYVAQLR